MKIRNINLFSIVWLALGIAIFLIGWCRWYYSIPMILLMGYVVYKQYQEDSSADTILIGQNKLWISFIIIFLLMLLCGVGGYVVQPNDHFGRNAIFRDIMNYSWPVYDSGENHFLCYYLAFWMVPASIGKLFHSMEIGFLMQLVWISVGYLLMFLQICKFVGKSRISYIFFIYLFSGIKIIECLLYLPIFGDGSVIGSTINILATNSSPGAFHAGPMVQLLYDPFNQTVPLFLGMILVINNLKSKYIPFVYSLLLLYAPFPFAGLAPMVLYLFIKNLNNQPKSKSLVSLFSIENITALLLIIVIGLFLTSNINGSHRGLRPSANIIADICDFFLYIIFEFGIYLFLGYKECRDKVLLWIAFASVCVFGWFQIGLHNDFCFRTNMPLIFILALLVIKRFYDVNTSKKIRIAILTCFLLGGIPAQIHPCLRFVSSYFVMTSRPQSDLNKYQHFIDVRKMYIMQQTKMRNDDLKSTFHCGSWGWMCDSFKGRSDSFFFKYIASK
jgi:hypothetical protein